MTLSEAVDQLQAERDSQERQARALLEAKGPGSKRRRWAGEQQLKVVAALDTALELMSERLLDTE